MDVLTQVRDAIQAMIDASGFDQVAGDARYLRRGQNLGDVNNVGSSRGNLNAAPINSPTFTGNPRSVTPAANDSDTSIATTAFVSDAVATIIAQGSDIDLATRNEHLSANPPTNEAAVPAYVLDMIEVLEASIVDGAPASRDTLDQLYDVLNAAKANLSGPVFTGNPRAPTPSTSDDDTSIATTGFVQNVRDALQVTIEGGAANSRDTLQELYTVLNATKANIASPTFTGNPFALSHADQQGTIRRASRRPRGYRVFSGTPAVGQLLRQARRLPYDWDAGRTYTRPVVVLGGCGQGERVAARSSPATGSSSAAMTIADGRPASGDGRDGCPEDSPGGIRRNRNWFLVD